jgi:bacterioferritin (cytochrome b1)
MSFESSRGITLTMPVPVATIDALNSLLEAEYSSIFRFLGEGSPYVSRADADLRRRFQELIQTNQRHAGEIADLIVYLGGIPKTFGPGPDDQYLAYLSVKFLMPKLVEAKKLCVQRYMSIVATLGNHPPDNVNEVLHRHLGELRAEVADLEKACDRVLAERKTQAPVSAD